MKRTVNVKYSQKGTMAAAHKFHCTVDGITFTHIQSSHKNQHKLDYFYITFDNSGDYGVPNISAYTEEELFQFSVVSDLPVDIVLLHHIQKHMVYCYDNYIFRRTELTLEY